MEIVLVYKENKIDCAFVFKRERESRPGRDLKKQREQKKNEKKEIENLETGSRF